MSENERLDVIEGTDEEGNSLLLQVERYFFYNGDEYVLLKAMDAAEETLYVMKVQVSQDEEGEAVEDFLPVEEELMESLLQVVSAQYVAQQELDILPEDDGKA